MSGRLVVLQDLAIDPSQLEKQLQGNHLLGAGDPLQKNGPPLRHHVLLPENEELLELLPGIPNQHDHRLKNEGLLAHLPRSAREVPDLLREMQVQDVLLLGSVLEVTLNHRLMIAPAPPPENALLLIRL